MNKQKLLISLKLLMFLKKQAQLDQEMATQELIQKLLSVIERLTSDYKKNMSGGGSLSPDISQFTNQFSDTTTQESLAPIKLPETNQSPLEIENELLKADLKEKDDFVKQIEKQYEIVVEQVESYSSMMEMTVNYTNNQYLEAKEELAALRNEQTKFESKVDYLQEYLDSSHEMFKMALTSIDQDVSATKNESSEVQNELMEVQSKLSDAQSENSEVQNELIEVQNKLSDAQNELSAMETKLSEIQNSHNNTQGELSEVQNEIEHYKGAYEEDLQNSLEFTHQLTTKYFDTKKQLVNLFSKVLYFSHPDKEYNGNVFFVIEKFGITYLVMIKASLEGLEGETFAMVSSFALNNIIKVKKYINSSKLIEEYFLSIEPALMMLRTLKDSKLEVAVSLLDTANYEVEFASTGLPIYSLIDHKINAYVSGESDQKSESLRSVGLRNKYRVQKINFNKSTSLFFSSSPLVKPGTDEANSLGKVIENSGSDSDVQNEKLQEFCTQELDEIEKNKDLLIVGLTF